MDSTSKSSSSNNNVEPGTVIADRYEVRERIGSGGMGMVFRVIDRELNDVAAVKLLHPHLAADETVFQRFRNEVLVARSLAHPNIVRTYDIGRDDKGFYYISMEFVDGVSLRDRIPNAASSAGGDMTQLSAAPMSFEETVGVLCQIMSGVSYAHGKGVIHRDLKPANILISNDGEVKLGDFGTARIMGMDTSLTQTGQIIGTPDYMSPEQIRGEGLDQSCDIYSLGIIAYELFTGERPFIADSSVAVAFKHLNEPLPAFANDERGVPAWAEEICNKATAKKKEERYSSVVEFAEALHLQMPELSKATGFYSVESTWLRRPSAEDTQSARAETADSAVNGNAGAEEKPAPAENQESSEASPKKEKKKSDGFEFGDAELSPDDSWKFEFGGAGKKGEESSKSSTSGSKGKLPAVTISRRSPLVAVGGLLAALVALLLGIREIGPLNESVGGVLRGWHKDSDKDYSRLASLLNVELAPLSESSSTDAATADDRRKLEEELLALESPSAKEAPAEKAKESPPKKELAKKEEVKPPPKEEPKKAEPAPKKQEEPTKLAKVTPSPKKEPEKKPEKKVETKPVEKEPPPPPPVPKTPEPAVPERATLVFRKDSRVVSGSEQLSVDSLGAVRWDSSVSGLVGIGEREMRKALELRVLRPNGKQVTAIRPRAVEPASQSRPAARVRGNFAALKSYNLEAGSYKIEVVYGGQVLTSKPLSLYRARVRFGATPSADKVKIVNASNFSGTPSSSDAAPATPPKEEAPAVEPVTQEPAVTSPSTLPRARGMETAEKPKRFARNISTLDMDLSKPTEPIPPPAPAPAAVERKSYKGSFVFQEEDGTRSNRLIVLELSNDAGRFKGTAELEKLGRFKVRGRTYSNGGWELYLVGDTETYRFVAAKRGGKFRGFYSTTGGAAKRRGRWELEAFN